jgi:hypothetical protein
MGDIDFGAAFKFLFVLGIIVGMLIAGAIYVLFMLYSY